MTATAPWWCSRPRWSLGFNGFWIARRTRWRITIASSGPLTLVKHGQLPRGSRRLETLAASDVPDLLKTIAKHEHAACRAAISASVDLYRKLRDALDDGRLIRNPTAERVALAYLDAVPPA